MTNRIAAVLLAGSFGLGCSSNGSTGPQGPPGPKGDTGAGTPGISVLSAQLSPGSVDCPTGGSQFTSVSGTTFACNGLDGQPGPTGLVGPSGPQGAQGPTGLNGGPGVLVRDADGVLLGRAQAFRAGTEFPSQMFVLLSVQVGGPGTPKVLLWREVSTGSPRFIPDCLNSAEPAWFSEADCTGTVFVSQSIAPKGLPCRLPSSRLATSTGGSALTAAPFRSRRFYLGACENVVSTASGVFALIDLGSDASTGAAPLQLEPE